MPLFKITTDKISAIEQSKIKEKKLQYLVENNLKPIFNCRFIASEFSTGAKHSGRIDTLALSEENNPVIIEYKKDKSPTHIEQSLFYLSWLQDHRGDFDIAVQKKLGKNIEIDWSTIRVICIADNYSKYNLHAVQVMGVNIELWKYRIFNNSTIYFEEIFNQSSSQLTSSSKPERVPRKTKQKKKIFIEYTFDQHLEGKLEKIKELARDVQDYILELDLAIEQAPKKFYIAYKMSQNIVCMEVQKQRIHLYLKLNPFDVSDLPELYRDLTDIGHYGTGDVGFTIKTKDDIEKVKPYIEMAYHKVGG